MNAGGQNAENAHVRPRLLDLYSCAGGAGAGYERAGFDVVGVDIDPQPNYPFEFHQADARPELIDPVRICGTGLGQPIRRHRLFESNVSLVGIACEHQRYTEPKYWTGWRPKGEHRLSTVVQIYGNAGGREHWPAALGVDWMTPKEMTECVPPSYTEHLGRQLANHLTGYPMSEPNDAIESIRSVERFAIRWASGGRWQWKEFDSRAELLDTIERDLTYYYSATWDRGTEIWRLETPTSVVPAELMERPDTSGDHT